YLMKQLVDELEQTLFGLMERYSNKISIDFLFNTVQSREARPPPPLWHNFVQAPSDLVTFLHMNSRIFLVQANLVSLTNERLQWLREKKVKESQSQNLQSGTSDGPVPVKQADNDQTESSQKDTKRHQDPVAS